MQVYILIRKVLISKAIDVKDVVYKNIKMQKGVSKLRKKEYSKHRHSYMYVYKDIKQVNSILVEG